MGGIKCGAGSKFPTCNHDGALARPQFTKFSPLTPFNLVYLQTLRHIQKRLYVPMARYRLARRFHINIFSPRATA